MINHASSFSTNLRKSEAALCSVCLLYIFFLYFLFLGLLTLQLRLNFDERVDWQAGRPDICWRHLDCSNCRPYVRSYIAFLEATRVEDNREKGSP